ncbi:hypothetical protein ACSBIU_003115, partial [Klebsiella variicola]
MIKKGRLAAFFLLHKVNQALNAFSLSKGKPACASSFKSLRFQFFSSEYAHIANETLFRSPPVACISEPSSG